jgi:hypothetical protein
VLRSATPLVEPLALDEADPSTGTLDQRKGVGHRAGVAMDTLERSEPEHLRRLHLPETLTVDGAAHPPRTGIPAVSGDQLQRVDHGPPGRDRR